MPVITNKVEENATGTNERPATTVSSEGSVGSTPSPSNANVPGELSGGPDAMDGPAPTRPISASRTNSSGKESGVGDIDPSQASAPSIDTHGHRTSRFVFNAVVAVTLAFLAFFHYVAMDTTCVVPDTPWGALAAPNSWELPSFVSFMQTVAILSCANVDAPHAALVSFTDSFSWVNFVVRGSASPLAKTHAAANVLSDMARAHQRTLASANDDAAIASSGAFGILQFALRMNVFELDLFVRAWTFCFIVLSCLLALVVITALVAGASKRRGVLFTLSTMGRYAAHMEEASHRLQGFTVWFATIAVLPLATVSMYELMRNVTSTAGIGSISGVFSLAALIFLGDSILVAGWIVSRCTNVDLSKYRAKVTFGVLYTNLKFEFRAFFAVSLAVQYATGLLAASVVAPSTQLFLLMGLHLAYAILIAMVSPFISTLQLVFTVVFELVVVAVFGMAYGMAHTTNASLKRTLAYAVIVLVCIVVVGMFVRCLYKLWMFVVGTEMSAINSIYSQGAVSQVESMDHTTHCGRNSNDTLSLDIDMDNFTTFLTPTNTVNFVETNAKVYAI
ncbi:hypothetical protein DYB32_005348 [Aphanomyces invadans]|uniref:TRP C-terminal domain-containing protein n=1 Tax=Aphanomyces invadans TaxID=157072 RepID=A0A3R6Z3H0_9STRA|nr:hypothetical protein DYB32_005348 [Aphanomyces invadans]